MYQSEFDFSIYLCRALNQGVVKKIGYEYKSFEEFLHDLDKFEEFLKEENKQC